ncbi:FBD-associated F-box protein At5g18780-like [Lolium rigidum]|uniref:FBD-associated F-box protein At5g18780-like n=1 Tax=Lolium rigidum TaxID=89674 RepID=UPI001F5C8A95|nr:FBD-associated F-box protein At5g18780-like [Lolium rigidum]
MPKNKKASRAGGADRISALPDAILQHVLSFLQAREAVRSCVLARRWRYLWKSIPVLRLTGCSPVKEFRKFMDYLLVLRDRSPLDACVLNFTKVHIKELRSDMDCVNLWIRYALLCQVRVLSVAFCGIFDVGHLPVASRNLTNLELANVNLNKKFLCFSSCPSLEELKMTKCYFFVQEIFSRSLKCLSIEKCWFYEGRVRISVPSLTSLQLTDAGGKTPFLEDMPELVTATVRFTSACWETRAKSERTANGACGDTSCECCNRAIAGEPKFCYDASCECCYGHDDSKEGCMFLKGLSAATDLKLIAQTELIILERDLRRCPTFSKLKTLSLNEWCVSGGHSALICILQHTPVLENLSLQLSKAPDYIKPVKATYNLLEHSFASENLKIVEVTCEEVDERVHNIMKSLSTCGIPLEKINIRQTNKSSGCFNFICTGFSSL